MNLITYQSGPFFVRSGNRYTPAPGGRLSNVPAGDVAELLQLGCQPLEFRIPLAVFGLGLDDPNASQYYRLRGSEANADLMLGGAHGVSGDQCATEWVLPATFLPGSPISIVANANVVESVLMGVRVAGSSTLTAATIAFNLMPLSDNGLLGAAVSITPPQPLPATATDLIFVADGSTLIPGQRVSIGLTLATECSLGAFFPCVNSVRVRL